MPTAKRLPSGSWRCQVYAGKDDSGKRRYESFTAPTKKEAELLAAQFSMEREIYSDKNNLLLKVAMERYNESKEKVLSPSTMRGYDQYCRNLTETKGNYPLSKITSEVMQTWISEWSRNLSPKSVRNLYGYVIVVMKFFGYGNNLRITLPQKVPVDYHIVTDEELKQLLNLTEGTELNLAILLAAFIPARRSEICALTNADIDRKKNTVRINKAMVKDSIGQWIVKDVPKTFGSNRTVEIPKSIIDKIPNKTGRIIKANPNQIENRFLRAVAHLEEPFRFHDLRHYGASFLHAAGVPDHYVMLRGGWESPETLHRIYTHCLPQKTDEATGIVINKLNSIME